MHIWLHNHIKKPHTILHLLEERRSAFSSINQLPTKILILIFEALQDYSASNEIFPPATSGEVDRSQSWMIITRVCRHRTFGAELPGRVL